MTITSPSFMDDQNAHMPDREVAFVHFLGAAETVTGSKFLIDTSERKLLVDCGLFQGLKKLRMLNWQYLPVDVSSIDDVLLTHGHLDHVGFLPRLHRMGFKGRILGTRPTLDIAEIILKDSAKIQEEEAEQANREGYTRHDPAEPLYNLKDVEKVLEHFHPVEDGMWISLSANIQCRFQRVGHILGATFIELQVFQKRLVFSGDVGRPKDLLLEAPLKPREADYLFLESTYGGRAHPVEDVAERIAHIISDTVAKGGTVIIPSFAVERSQTLMFILADLVANRRIPAVPMIVDSPMGSHVLEVFKTHLEWHKLSASDCTRMCAHFHIVGEYAETLAWIDNPQPKIVIAGSGMVNGGRVLAYLQRYISLPETTVMLMGFQSEGTRGRQLLEGATEVKFYGAYHEVRARVECINSLSAHADEMELIDWLSDLQAQPEKLFLVHGEPKAADALRLRIKDVKGWNVQLPGLYNIETLDVGVKIP